LAVLLPKAWQTPSMIARSFVEKARVSGLPSAVTIVCVNDPVARCSVSISLSRSFA